MGRARRQAWDEIVSDLLVDLSLYLSSYAPLFLIMAVRFRPLWLEVFCGTLFFAGIAAGGAVLVRYRNVVGQEWRATRVEDRGYEVAGYLAAYLLPFVTVTEPDWRDLVGYGIFLLVAGIVYVRSGMLQINPTLYLIGWRVMQVTIGEGWIGYAIGPDSMRTGSNLKVRRISDRVFMATAVERHEQAA